MKRTIFIAFVAVLALASCQQVKQKMFKMASEQTNKQCPMAIDEWTRMDSTAYYDDKNTFAYFYSLINLDEDSTSIASLKTELTKNIPEALKNTPEMKPYKDAGVTLQYTYFSNTTQKELFRLEFPAEKY